MSDESGSERETEIGGYAVGPGAAGAPVSPPAIERIGGYSIVGVLGRGGMGVVYEATQENPRRSVALKVVRPEFAEPTLARRFALEAEALGRLQHPGIAQIYEAGTADAGHGVQPYFAMELVRGEPLTRYAERQGLSTRARLELMLRVCDAVHHAHQRGIIHRDLKPANILVDAEGQTKILDFGLARITDADVLATRQTEIGQIVGTLAYMSPEQVHADPGALDVRADVYALGVVLYELLAGRLPIDLTGRMLHEALRAIREDDPARLSTVQRVFRGDIETIVSKALEKAPERRYTSAAELAADIRHHLNDEPIVAQPPSTAYRMHKFARRHRGLVGAAAAVFVTLLAGLAVSALLAIRATRAERNATAEAGKSKAVSEFLIEMLASAQPSVALGRELTVRELLDGSAQGLDGGSLSAQPEIEGAIRRTIGSAYQSLGEYDRSLAQLERAVTLQRAGGPPLALDLLQSLEDLADVYYRKTRLDDADRIWDEAIALAGISLGKDSERYGQVLGNHGFYLSNTSRNEQAIVPLRDALAVLERHDAKSDLSQTVKTNLAHALAQEGEHQEAESLLIDALAVRRATFGDLHPRVANGLWYLASFVYQRHRCDEARPLVEECLAIRRKILPPNHPDTALALVTLAEVLSCKGAFAEARPLLDEALAIREATLGTDSPAYASALGDLAKWHDAQGRFAEAIEFRRRGLVIWEKVHGPDSIEVAGAWNDLALSLQNAGQIEESERAWIHALEIKRKVHGPIHRDVAFALANVCGFYARTGDSERAERFAREAVDVVRQVAPAGHFDLVFPLRQLSYLLQQRKAWAEAEPLEREALEIDRAHRPVDALENTSNLLSVANILYAQQRWADAEPIVREALRLREKHLKPEDWRIASTRFDLGWVLAALGKHDQAEPLMRENYEILQRSPDVSPDRKQVVRDRLEAYERERG